MLVVLKKSSLHAVLLSVYINWAPPSHSPLGKTPYFSPTFEFINPMQFSLQFIAVALALVTAAPAAPGMALMQTTAM